jgi:hypothetical protein
MGTLNVPVDDGDVEEVKVAELVERELASVFGARPYPAHRSTPPQLPIRQLPRPLPSNRQPVRAQMHAAVVPAGTFDGPRLAAVELAPAGTDAAHTV